MDSSVKTLPTAVLISFLIAIFILKSETSFHSQYLFIFFPSGNNVLPGVAAALMAQAKIDLKRPGFNMTELKL